jgi:lipopolysaccharide/colanic/teichoic acid biosynthesis glycosyltransferase
VFTIYKIRSMRVDSEARTGPIWTTSSRDPRITPVGRILRATHLDELPQLINVLRGEMALVGPRPERPEFAEALADEIPGYLNRLHVLPGVTGLAQVNLPPDSDLNSVRRKLVLDIKYIVNASLLLDLRIFVATLLPLVGISSGFATRLVKLDCTSDIARIAKNEDACADDTDSQPVQLSQRHIEFLDAMGFSR